MPSEVGAPVECVICHKRKRPVGRSVPIEMESSLCHYECPGYYEEPKPSDLWPGESRAEFGYGGDDAE